MDFPEKVDGKAGDPLYEKAYFKIADVDEYEAVKISVMGVDIAWERYDLIDNNGNMNTLSANFNEMEKYSRILVWVISGAGLIILFLIFQFWMKSRNREIGIMLSMGTSKIRILAQIMAEALMIAAVAVLVSFLAAPGVSGLTADYLVEQQVQSAGEQDLLDEGKVALSYEKSEQNVVGVQAEITFGMLIQDVSGIALLIAISICVSGIGILKRNPQRYPAGFIKQFMRAGINKVRRTVEMILEAKNIEYVYKSQKDRKVLGDISVRFEEKSFMPLSGPAEPEKRLSYLCWQGLTAQQEAPFYMKGKISLRRV